MGKARRRLGTRPSWTLCLYLSPRAPHVPTHACVDCVRPVLAAAARSDHARSLANKSPKPSRDRDGSCSASAHARTVAVAPSAGRRCVTFHGCISSAGWPPHTHHHHIGARHGRATRPLLQLQGTPRRSDRARARSKIRIESPSTRTLTCQHSILCCCCCWWFAASSPPGGMTLRAAQTASCTQCLSWSSEFCLYHLFTW